MVVMGTAENNSEQHYWNDVIVVACDICDAQSFLMVSINNS